MDLSSRRKNRRLMVTLVAVVFAMIGGSYAAVPLYRIFCQVTGFGGTTQVADKPSDTISDRVITVRFDSMVNGVPWAFQPEVRSMETRVGENTLAFYRAENRGETAVSGTATFNVTPAKAGQYFSKIECFCFTEQRLTVGQSVDMPVSFFIDPAIEDDRNLDDVKTITLSYTFFPMDEEEQEQDAPKTVSQVIEDSPTGNVN